jgi:NADH-quinone oxidoreductase subunit M
MPITAAPLLSLAIWVPILFGLGVLLTGRRSRCTGAALARADRRDHRLPLTIPLWTGFDTRTAAMQFVEFVAVDRAVQHQLPPRRRRHLDAVRAAEQLHHDHDRDRRLDGDRVARGAVHGRVPDHVGAAERRVLALDGVLFYVFFEATLIPMFLIIGVWGGPNRVYAALKFFLYTFLGSVLMLVALLYLYGKSGGSFAILDWHKLPLPLHVQQLLFFGLLLAFAVKVPMWPVHTWLPDAHTEAPTGGSVVLAAILLKLGAYGFIRFTLPILPDASRSLAWFMIGLSLIAVVYIGLVALVQTDMKKLIAYSSIAHMGFVTLGFFVFNAYGVEGGLIQMISHGFVSAALFLCVGVLYDRHAFADDFGLRRRGEHDAEVRRADDAVRDGRIAGCPRRPGFVGEFMVIMGAMKANFWLAFAAARRSCSAPPTRCGCTSA